MMEKDKNYYEFIFRYPNYLRYDEERDGLPRLFHALKKLDIILLHENRHRPYNTTTCPYEFKLEVSWNDSRRKRKIARICIKEIKKRLYIPEQTDVYGVHRRF